MPRIAPCLWLNGNAEEAARFYTGIFPSSEVTAVHLPTSWHAPEDARALMAKLHGS